MRVSIGDVRLFVEVVGTKLEHGDEGARDRPTVVALHGGPGFDHALTRDALDPLADAAQLVHYDMRGHGRSDDGPRERWTLETWADDVVQLCEALGIERPVVVGHPVRPRGLGVPQHDQPTLHRSSLAARPAVSVPIDGCGIVALRMAGSTVAATPFPGPPPLSRQEVRTSA